MVVTSDVLVA